MLYIPKEPPAVYLLMVLAFVLLCISRSARFLMPIGVVGGVLIWFCWKWDLWDFEELFYGDLGVGHVRFGQFMFLLLLLMVALAVIARAEDLDEAL